MKKLLFIILITLLLPVSCATSKLIPRDRIVYESYYDYSEFAKNGFLISPDPYQGEFQPCGEISIDVYPAKIIKKGKDKFDPSMNTYESNEYLIEEEISGQELLKIIVEKAKTTGADALTNFRARAVKNSYYNTTIHQYIEYFSHYELTGFAIKRK